VARELLPILTATENDLQRQTNLQQLAYRLRLPNGRALIDWAQQYMRQQAQVAPRSAHDVDSPSSSVTVAAAPTAAGESASAPTVRAIANEYYCLAMFLADPDLYAYVHRRFREVAARAGAARVLLNPLAAEDFTHADYRAIFSLLVEATAQHQEDLLDYLQARLPDDFGPLLENLLTAPLDAFEQRAPGNLRAEVQIIRLERDHSAQMMARTEGSQELRALELRAFELRRARLKSSGGELFHLQREAEGTLRERHEQQALLINQAVRVLDEAMRGLRAVQRAVH
jgi:hypothetical protein